MASDDDPQEKMAKDLQSIEEFLPDFDELDKGEFRSLYISLCELA